MSRRQGPHRRLHGSVRVRRERSRRRSGRASWRFRRWIRATRPSAQFTELMSGWYLRGDVGYRWNHGGSVHVVIRSPASSYANSLPRHGRLRLQVSVVPRRSDVRFRRRRRSSARHTTVSDERSRNTPPRSTRCTVLANGYVDLRHLGRLHALCRRRRRRRQAAEPRTTSTPPIRQSTIASGSGQASSNFAWAYDGGRRLSGRRRAGWSMSASAISIWATCPVNSQHRPAADRHDDVQEPFGPAKSAVGFRYLLRLTVRSPLDAALFLPYFRSAGHPSPPRGFYLEG